MLKSLYISNYALIDQMEVDFDAGLTILTGETGAGKSIILGALALILGERANSQTIRDKNAKTVVEATFDVGGFGLQSFFETADIDYADECVLRRELTATGRSRAFVNDTPVQLGTLKELATRLVDIHSQHSNMLLANPTFQLDILDSIAHCESERSAYTALYREMKTTERQLAEVRQRLEQARQEQDYISFQCAQLQQLHLADGEDEQLEALQRRLANASDIKEQLWGVHDAIDNEDNSMLQHLKTAVGQLQSLDPLLEEVAGMADRANAALIELKDIAASVDDLQEKLEVNPAELERVENRLNEIYALERKHHVQSVKELLELQTALEQQLADISGGDERVQELQQRLNGQRLEAEGQAAVITMSRRKAAKQFEQDLVAMAVGLGLRNVSFKVDFTPVPLNANGADAVEFMMAFNKNQQPMPVRDTASGGEISRVMLCIKAIVARSMNLPTIIFDEVDTGVSGDIASMIGELMGDIAHSIQVIAITHLPQVASHGSHHFKVYKTDGEDGTITNVKKLNAEEHVMEIARMLSGRELDQAAVENAKSLIKQNMAGHAQ